MDFNKNLILGKSALTLQQLEAKDKVGNNGIEIQLFEEFNDACPDISEKLFEDNKLIINKAPIKVVHAPLWGKTKDCVIEVKNSYFLLDYTCHFANLIGELKNRIIPVVIHANTSLTMLKNLGIAEDLKTTLLNLVERYPKIKLAIENTTNIECDFDNNLLEMRNSITYKNGHYHSANIDLANFCNHPRIGCTIDYCHLLMTENLFKIVYNYLGRDSNEHVDLCTSLITNAAPKIFLFHLSQPRNAGYSYKNTINHGLPYNKESIEDITTLNRFIGLYELTHKINGNNDMRVPITLEVFEEDYSKGINYQQTFESLETAWGRKC